MRIRKHAKLAGLVFAASAADLSPPALQSHICHLNQSPWDAISFPPDSASSPFQVDGEDSFTVNASFGDSPGAVESVVSMKTSVVDGQNAINNVDKIEVANERKDKLGFGKNGVILCCKRNGKDWKCKKSENVAIRRRPRPKKPARSGLASSNPYEFYYYSGFGPRWGKKRGTTTNVEFIRVESDTKDVDEVKVIVTKATTTPYSSSSSQIDNEEFDYIEDDDDDDDDDGKNVQECGEFGKKRGRKPIKARSLKSLM